MEPMVSMIVPVYNAQDWLERCVESILGQEYQNFELLLMDDGSRDGSAAICDGYAARDSRVRVVHKENSGVSNTRNQAIDLAQGKYLQFVDSDDWISPDATKLLVRSAEEFQCDLVIADFYRVVGERLAHKGDIEEDGLMDRETFAGHMMESPADFYYGVLWNKLYRRDIIQTHHLRMDPEISWCEDFMFNLEYIRYAQRFYALPVPIYYYVKTKGSLVSQGMSISRTVKMKLMVFECYNDFYKQVLDEQEYERVRRRVYRFLVDACNDGAVLPVIFPGSQKLGNERKRASAGAAEGQGFLMERYQMGKLLDYQLESVALKYDLTIGEARLLMLWKENPQPMTRREWMDYADLTASALNRGVQKLVNRDYIRLSEEKPPRSSGTGKRPRKKVTVTLLPEAQPVISDLLMGGEDFDRTRFAGFTDQEKEQYRALHQKMLENIRRVL